MAAIPVPVTVNVRLVLTNAKAFRAINCIANVLKDVAEDFDYRDDVKRALRAAVYLGKHIDMVADDDAAEILLANGCEIIEPEEEQK